MPRIMAIIERLPYDLRARANNPLRCGKGDEPIDLAWSDIQRSTAASTYQGDLFCERRHKLGSCVSERGWGRIRVAVSQP